MNNLIIIGIVVILLTLIILTLYKSNIKEHLTPASDEAIQNIASMYNKDQISIGKIKVGNAILSLNNKTGKTDLFIDGDIHVGGNIYMNPDMDGNPKTSGSSAIIFGTMGMREYSGHLSMINATGTNVAGTSDMPKGGVVFLARNDGYGTWSTGPYNNIPKNWNSQAAGDAANFGTYKTGPDA